VTVLRIGLVGAGGIAGAHARAYRQLGSEGLVRVLGVCDVDAAAASRRAAELSAPHVSTDYRDLLALDLDAVDICLPHDLHAPVALAAIARGRHVLVEKPLATSLADGERMVDAARAAGVVLQVGHNERFDPQYQEMKGLLDRGVIGEVFAARADHNQDLRLPEGHWLRSEHRSGGGAVIGSGIHRVDLLRWFLGEVREVYSVHRVLPDRLEGEAAALTMLRFEGGAVATLSTNWAVRRSPWYELMWLYGTRGSVHNVGGLHVDSELLPECDGGFVQRPLPPKDSFTEEIRHFAACVAAGRAPLTRGEEGLRALAVCLAAYRSARSGVPVAV
jgi:predicted dehydrogenase